jgi:hypothetical protein
MQACVRVLQPMQSVPSSDGYISLVFAATACSLFVTSAIVVLRRGMTRYAALRACEIFNHEYCCVRVSFFRNSLVAVVFAAACACMA